MKKEKIKTLAKFLMLLLMALLSPITAEAKDTNKNAMKAYKNYLQNHKRVNETYQDDYKVDLETRYFAIVDINGDGIKELFVTEHTYKNENNEKVANETYVFTYKSGIVQYLGNSWAQFTIQYNRKRKKVIQHGMGAGAGSDSYYIIKNDKLDKFRLEWENDANYHLYYYLNGKKISKKKYDKYYNKYFKNEADIQDIVFYRNNSANRKKKLK